MDVSTEPTVENGPAMTCPTCGAEQTWSDECRRCKCDLSDLRAVWRAARHERTACLRALRAGNLNRALSHARCYAKLDAGDESQRLIAVCFLLRGDWRAALAAI